MALDWGKQPNPNMTERELTELKLWLCTPYNFESLVKSPISWTHSEATWPENMLIWSILDCKVLMDRALWRRVGWRHKIAKGNTQNKHLAEITKEDVNFSDFWDHTSKWKKHYSHSKNIISDHFPGHFFRHWSHSNRKTNFLPSWNLDWSQRNLKSGRQIYKMVIVLIHALQERNFW